MIYFRRNNLCELKIIIKILLVLELDKCSKEMFINSFFKMDTLLRWEKYFHIFQPFTRVCVKNNFDVSFHSFVGYFRWKVSELLGNVSESYQHWLQIVQFYSSYLQRHGRKVLSHRHDSISRSSGAKTVPGFSELNKD